jgi:anti-sigma regulatory factor (Ser/Thr protein kinase)
MAMTLNPSRETGTVGSAGFRHEALLYEGLDEFLLRTCGFIRDSLEDGARLLVAVMGEKVDAIRSGLGPDAADVRFEDMAEVGRNPGRILSLWEDFAREPSDRPARGIAEPIYAGRAPEELVESQRHEELLNLAFDRRPLWIVCPYDTGALQPGAIDAALRSHPIFARDGVRGESVDYVGTTSADSPFAEPLPEPAGRTVELAFERDDLRALRGFVGARAEAFGLETDRIQSLTLAADEIASNTLRHAGGPGVLRVWEERDRLVCEVRDRGRIVEPLVGRFRPRPDVEGGFGLWIANQLCDLVQIRSFDRGAVVRLHMVR